MTTAKRTVWVCVASTTEGFVVICDENKSAPYWEMNETFLGWATDWVKIEINGNGRI